MKKLLILFVLLFSISAFSQLRFEEFPKDNQIILFKKQLKCLIEIDGHIFDNEKSKDPIYFEASLSGIKIYSKAKIYSKRECEKEKCEITHLTDCYFTPINIGNIAPPIKLLGD